MKVVLISIICWRVGHFAVNWKLESDFSECKLILTEKPANIIWNTNITAHPCLKCVAWNDKNMEKGDKMSLPLLLFTNVIGYFWKNIKHSYKISEKSTNKVKIKP